MISPRILMFTARSRYESPAIDSVYAMLRSTSTCVEWLQIDEQPYGKGGYTIKNRNILYLLSLARTRMLAGDYTHLFLLEDDMIVPSDALDTLLYVESPVVYGVACLRSGPPHKWNVLDSISESSGVFWSEFDPKAIAAKAKHGEIIDCMGVGFSCTLIDRATIAAIPWRAGAIDQLPACDWPFAVDCQRAGIRQRAHLGVQCGHLLGEPSARILWPDPQGYDSTGMLYRYHYYERPISIKTGQSGLIEQVKTIAPNKEVSLLADEFLRQCQIVSADKVCGTHSEQLKKQVILALYTLAGRSAFGEVQATKSAYYNSAPIEKLIADIKQSFSTSQNTKEIEGLIIATYLLESMQHTI